MFIFAARRSFFNDNFLCAQTLILSRALKFDVNHAYEEIQKKVDAEHARNEVLNSERDALLKKVEGLEAKVKEFESERASLRIEVTDAKK